VDHVAEMLACVRASGLKLTPQRMAIVQELAADPTHPTAQELFERLRPALPTMSFATVYNTLDALAAAGLCASLSLSPGPARFDPNMDPHHHAVCDRCGLVRDVLCNEGDPHPGQPEGGPARQPPGFQIRAVELTYRGLCAACATLAPDAPARPRRSTVGESAGGAGR
jgi:Fur family peroxide stress response transcriptional regulator